MTPPSDHDPLERFGIPIAATEARFRQRAQSEESVSLESRGAAGIETILQSNDPERLRMRLRRAGLDLDAGLASLHESAMSGYRIPPSVHLEANVESRQSPGAEDAAQAARFLERIIGERDFVGARFLEAGARAARAVGRIRIRTRDGGAGFGTGSLVSPRLVLTNHHVFREADDAALSTFELNVEDGVDGKPLTPDVFKFDPAAFFVADPQLDFCLVAVAPRSKQKNPIEEYGWNPPFEDDDPVLIKEYVNIIQHPDGRPKEIALRDNQVTDLLPDFLHYRADTEPGSSGAPIFSDDWELVGLHHSGVPRRVDGKIVARGGGEWQEWMGENAVDWIANEGVRISRILAFVKALKLRDAKKKSLRDALFQAARPTNEVVRPPRREIPVNVVSPESEADEPIRPSSSEPGSTPTVVSGSAVTITVPLQITVSLGTAVAGGGPVQVASAASIAATAGLATEEAVTIDPNYGNREGYDPEFLGTGGREVPLPRLSAAQRKVAAVVSDAPASRPHELKYHHYSVIMNGRRRLAFLTAVNIDGKLARNPRRDTDRWFYDPRISRDAQVGGELYTANVFDRGHLVRRLDPAWGRTDRIIKVANDDTFHFTNCSPQHKRFNQGKNLWAGLEDFLLERATDDRKRLTVFTGPVFTDQDPDYRGIAIPQQFWKVAVIVRPNGKLAALGFLVSQADLLKTNLEEAAVDVARTFQVPVKQVARLTGLDFGPLAELDGPSVDRFGREAVSTETPLESLDDIILPTRDDEEDEEGGEEGRAEASRGRRGSTATAAAPAYDEEGVAGGPPYIMVSYDENGRERTDAPGGLASDRVVAALRNRPVTDVFLMSHGWMGDVPAARDQYRRWSAVMAGLSSDVARAREVRPNFHPLIVGLHWPSKPWGDEQLTPDESRAAAGAGADGVDALVKDYLSRLGHRLELRKPLRTVISAAYSATAHRKMPAKVVEAYKEIAEILDLTGEGAGAAPGHDHDAFDPVAIFELSRKQAEAARAEEGLEFFSADSLLDPLRTASFWTMKGRARVVGERGAYLFLARLIQATEGRDVRFHLMGHSFGGIVMSAAVAGPPGVAPHPRPVHSMCLVQGALSLWSYCSDIPVSPGTPGYFRRIIDDQLVTGPIITTRTDYDRALRIFYPRGAQLAGDFERVASLPKYGAVGIYGVQGPGLQVSDELIKRANAPYAFHPGWVVNLDASGVIRNGGGVAGAHSDIDHPEVAHAIWSAALVE
ncbi:MAG: DNA/RNA non-specific endonuclease [Isosphaeraceae bacterium]